MKIIGVSGHRKLYGKNFLNQNSKIYKKISNDVKNILLEMKPDLVITGMALGFDQLVANVCISLKIPFRAAIPFKGYESKWFEKSKKEYYELLKNASDIVYVCDGIFASWKNLRRNEYIVDNSEFIIFLYNGKSRSGTGHCFNYAKKQHVNCKNIFEDLNEN